MHPKKCDGFSLSVKDMERELEQILALRALSDTPMSRGKNKVYGIDLGTTYSSIANVRNGVPEIISDIKFGNATLASCPADG